MVLSVPMGNRRLEGCPDLVRGEVPVAADFAPVGPLSAIDLERGGFAGEVPLRITTFYLVFATRYACQH